MWEGKTNVGSVCVQSVDLSWSLWAPDEAQHTKISFQSFSSFNSAKNAFPPAEFSASGFLQADLWWQRRLFLLQLVYETLWGDISLTPRVLHALLWNWQIFQEIHQACSCKLHLGSLLYGSNWHAGRMLLYLERTLSHLETGYHPTLRKTCRRFSNIFSNNFIIC